MDMRGEQNATGASAVRCGASAPEAAVSDGASAPEATVSGGPSSVRAGIWTYIRERILPQYEGFDPAHRVDHAEAVIAKALEMSRHYDVDADMVAIAAACHDLGLSEDRKTHHLVSGRLIRENADLRKWFSDTQIETIAQAAEDHRASSDHEPRSIYGRLIAEADRQIVPGTVIRRTIQFGLGHYPELDMEGHWRRMLDHLHEKYADGGYLRLWIPESPNAAGLEALRAIIRDEARLRTLFEQIYSRELGAE